MMQTEPFSGPAVSKMNLMLPRHSGHRSFFSASAGAARTRIDSACSFCFASGAIIFCPTSKMSHDYGRRDGCSAAGMTDVGVGSGDLFGFGLLTSMALSIPPNMAPPKMPLNPK